MIHRTSTTIFLTLFISVQNHIYLYQTQDGREIEYYDCIVTQTLDYCRRPQPPVDLMRDNDSLACEQNHGIVHRFNELQSQKINITTILHEWKSSLERVERYARFLRDPSLTNEYICQCTERSSFGKNCEYRLPLGSMFNDILSWQAVVKENMKRNEYIYGSIVCYETLTCDTGSLCLDWREICDGIQQCMFGDDEDNCDLLEMNICADDEYRCMNGMCIPGEYFLDGEFDCLDWSDEMQYKKSVKCPKESASVQCDDHICLPNQRSCGDGQCTSNRATSLIVKAYSDACFSERDQYYMCETHPTSVKWTMSDGGCLEVNSANRRPTMLNTGEADTCQYMLRCALSQGGHINCPCWKNSTCSETLVQKCSLSLIPYPQRPLVTAYISLLYNRSRKWQDKHPSSVRLNGTIKCRDLLISINRTIPFHTALTIRGLIQDSCMDQLIDISARYYHANDSTDLCHEWNSRMSITRQNDGFINCLNKQDERMRSTSELEMGCAHMKKYRFHCSMDQPTCFSVTVLGNKDTDCKNTFDEFWFGKNHKIIDMKCNTQAKDDCIPLRQYVEQSWLTKNRSEISPKKDRIPFHFYCNTFWDLESTEDENTTLCQGTWLCDHDQWQCETGQCVEAEWQNDYEEDCADSSDEKEVHLERRQHALAFRPIGNVADNQSYFLRSTCHSENFFLCLSPRLSSFQFVCLNQSQLSDGKIDCVGAVDELHTLRHCSSPLSMLGKHFRCASTNLCLPYLYHCQENYRCTNRSDDEAWCSKRVNVMTDCDGETDFTCFDGQCISSGRCNEISECPFSEDEYMCDYGSSTYSDILPYRAMKHSKARTNWKTFSLPRFPLGDAVNTSRPEKKPVSNSANGNLFNSTASRLFVLGCNRGVGVQLSNGSLACFCPPQYYGDQCQYHADRLSVLLHLNLSQSIYANENDPSNVLQLLVSFVFDKEILMTHEFPLRPALEGYTPRKKIVHFVYSHSNSARQRRQIRFDNRSALLESHPYSIRIEAYENRPRMKPFRIALWQYPIRFHFLPVYRFAQVLHLTTLSQHATSCSSDLCRLNEECQPLMNQPTQHVCLCKANFSGPDCFVGNEQCVKGYCAGNSLCIPNYRQSLLPYCLCSSNRYGARCELEYDSCLSKPCLHGGTCLSTERLDQVLCLCTKEYHGLRCEVKKSFIRLSLRTNHQYAAGVVQSFYINSMSLDLILARQQVFQNLPRLIEYYYEEITVPSIVLLKVYSFRDDHQPEFYILSVHHDVTFVEGATQISPSNRCSHIHSFAKDVSPIQYHDICRNNTKLLCFRDGTYMCLCVGVSRRRAECFLYDYQLDQCSHCFGHGHCLRGDHSRSGDFLCLCPPCSSGQQCQFSRKSFAITLDQLLFTDLMSTHQQRTIYLLLAFSLFGFLLAIPSNLCSFAAFRRKACLRFGIGHYLLCQSIVNQINLGLLFVRLVHIVMNATGTHLPLMWNHIFCKLFNYLLVSSSRIVVWLSSLIAIERVYTALVVNGRWLKQPHIARRLMIFSMIGILLAGVYEFFFYRSLFIDDDSQASMCVFDFPATSRSVWTIFHLLISVIGILFPVLVNLCSTIMISVIVVKKKMNIVHAKKKTSSAQSALMNLRRYLRFIFDVLNENKELVIGPGVTLIPQLFSLPFFVLSLALDCQNIENSWLRYLLIVSYWISFTPQMIGFFLYISPSSFYSDEWRKTRIGKWIQ